MLDRLVVEDFLDAEFDDSSIEIPDNINKAELVETFALYVENDLYEWLKDNFSSFFDHIDSDWSWVEDTIARYKREEPTHFVANSNNPSQVRPSDGDTQ